MCIGVLKTTGSNRRASALRTDFDVDSTAFRLICFCCAPNRLAVLPSDEINLLCEVFAAEPHRARVRQTERQRRRRRHGGSRERCVVCPPDIRQEFAPQFIRINSVTSQPRARANRGAVSSRCGSSSRHSINTVTVAN